MSPSRLRALRYALVVVGLIFVFGVYPLIRIWPSGWRWAPDNELYLQMILGIYATLGVFLILAARDPERNLSLIWFTVWVNLVHGGVMFVQALTHPEHRMHLAGDVPALWLTSVVLAVLTPRRDASPLTATK